MNRLRRQLLAGAGFPRSSTVASVRAARSSTANASRIAGLVPRRPPKLVRVESGMTTDESAGITRIDESPRRTREEGESTASIT